MRKIKKVLKISRIIVVIWILLWFIPVKFAIQKEDIDYEKEFYIVYFWDFTTDFKSSKCYITGGKDNLQKHERIIAELSGEDPRNEIINVICENAQFVIYGTLEQNDNNNYILHSDKWELFETKGLRSINLRDALTIGEYSKVDRISPFMETFSYVVIILSVLFELLEKILKKLRKKSQ